MEARSHMADPSGMRILKKSTSASRLGSLNVLCIFAEHEEMVLLLGGDHVIRDSKTPSGRAHNVAG